MKYRYPAIVHNDEDGYWIEFPDIEGCHTFSDSLEGLLKNAEEALACHIEEELESGKYLPQASDENSIITDTNTFIRIISIDIPENESVMNHQIAVV